MSGYRRAGGLVTEPIGALGRDRSLAALPAGTVDGIRTSDLRRYAFPLGVVALFLTFVLPGNLLISLGVYSDAPGGNPLTKFHPTTYVAVVAALFALYGRRHVGGMTGVFRECPALAWSFVLILVSMVYSGLSIGIGGIAVYVETYLAAALLLIALETGTERQLRFLGYAILAFALLSIVISVIEGRVHTHFLTPMPGVEDNEIEEFRGAGLYVHPLTGALVTSMALFLALGMRLRPWITMAVFGAAVIGLMSFGGRSALFMTILLVAAAALFQLAAGLVTRRLSVGFLAAFIAGSLLVPALFVVLTTMTGVGQRIVTHLYLDDSAEVRVIQWRILHFLNHQDILFGMSTDRIDFLKVQIGLLGRDADIENFWLLIFLNLGVVGFPLLVGALFLLLLHLGQRTNTPMGWMIVMATLLICSTNNSLGRKTPDLLFLAGCVTALSGFRHQRGLPLAMQDPPAPTEPVRRTALTAAPDGRIRALSDRPVRRPTSTLLSGPGRA